MSKAAFTRIGKAQGGIFAYRRDGSKDKFWAVDYRAPHPPHVRKRQMGFLAKVEAIKFREEMDLERVKGSRRAVEELTLADASTRYLAARLAEGKASTSYYFLPDAWVPALGAKRLTAITPEEIETTLDRITTDRGLRPSSRNRALAQLTGLFSWCVGRGWLDRHPTAHGRVARQAEGKGRQRWLRQHEVEALCAMAGDLGEGWLAPIVRFAVSTGMRLSEVTGLRRVDFQEDDHGAAHVVVQATKNGSRLTYPLEGWARAYVSEQAVSLPFAHSYIFAGPRGGCAHTAIRRTLPKVVTGAGLAWGRDVPDGITFHTFRHSMASLGLNAGISESVIQQLGNWKSRQMVSRYAHVAEETMRKGAAQVANLVTPNFAEIRPRTPKRETA